MATQAANGMPGYTAKVEDPSGAVLEFYNRFAKLVALHEREACAQLCEASPEPDGLDLADRIRARGHS